MTTTKSSAEISGSANANATVTVNLQRAVRQGNYFWDELGVSNSTSPLWLALTNLAVLNNGTNADIIATNLGNVFVKQTPEVFNYDADGSLTNDGRWAYTWDAENRLVKMTANTAVGPQYQLNFAYDAQSRRIQKIVATNGVAISTNNFVYDGWNLVAEMGSSVTLVRRYVWGTDLSGSAQGAGGVGGLIAVSYHGTATTNCFTALDGNGNIAALINAADGSVSANYEYAPFGEVVRETGPLARDNPFRFSTKYQDDESDLLYYGYRYYNASTGRWSSRDPSEEEGGLNLYGFVGGNKSFSEESESESVGDSGSWLCARPTCPPQPWRRWIPKAGGEDRASKGQCQKHCRRPVPVFPTLAFPIQLCSIDFNPFQVPFFISPASLAVTKPWSSLLSYFGGAGTSSGLDSGRPVVRGAWNQDGHRRGTAG
jgi:RHS repeat-associated protein